MKQCPECNEVFDNQKAFCDMDGSELVKLTDSPRAISQTNAPAGTTSVWVTGVIGGLIGIIVCVMLYLAFLAPGRDTAQQNRSDNQNTETVPAKSNQVAVVPTSKLPSSETTASPTESASPAEAEASPAASPAAAATPVSPALNRGPIATGDKTIAKGERAIIKMKDGSTVEADAAWEDAQGIWFRRSGVVSFLDKSRVEAITEAPEKHPASVESKTP
jgi:cytoskeletal protein RodZ